MITSDLTPYQSLIDQLLTFNKFDQLLDQFQPDDSLLTPELLNALSLRQIDATDEEKSRLVWITKELTYLYSRKCLLAFLKLPEEEAILYAQAHLLALASSTNYSELESLLTQLNKQPDVQSFLNGRQHLLAAIVANAYIVNDSWLQRRQFLLNSLDWLNHKAAIRELADIADNEPHNRVHVEQLRGLINQCQREGVEPVVNLIDLDWLEGQAQQSKNEEKITYLKQAISLLADQKNKRWANLLVDLGNTYQELLIGDRATNLELAIDAYQKALSVLTRQNTPQDWAILENSLGVAYQDRIQGNQGDNLEMAIQAYKNALIVRTQKTMPNDWASTQNNLGSAYQDRIHGDKANNLEVAIQIYQQALEVRTQQDFPLQWAVTQNNLGTVYSIRIRGNKADNLEISIRAYKNALMIRSRQDTPYDWALTQNNLGTVYGMRILGNRAENLEMAIQAYENALLVRTQQDSPHQWASTQNNLGNAYLGRVRGESANNQEKAIQAYKNALLVYTQQDAAQRWALIQNNLGNVYRERIRGERAQNLEVSILAYQQSLLIRTQQDAPHDWAMTQNNLGNVYQDRINGNKAINLELALQAYENALRVYTRQAAPYDWALTQINIGNVYRERVQGMKAQNLKAAILACEQALLVYTQQDAPRQWAAIQNNLGNTYRERNEWERTDDLKNAFQAYNNALTIRTKETVPDECRQTALNIANLLYAQRRWLDSRKAYELAHEALELMRGETVNEESRRQLSQDNATLYARLIHCCLLVDDPEAAANYALAGKSRTLTEQLAGERQTLSELLDQDPTLANEYTPIQQRRQELDEILRLMMSPPFQGDNRSAEEVEHQITKLYSQVASLRQEINSLIDSLVFKYPALSTIQPLPPLTLADAQTLSTELGKIPIVEYIQHGGGWGAFIIHGVKISYVPLADDLMVQIGSSLDLFLDHDTDGRTLFWLVADWRQRLEQLYQKVFKPLLPYLSESGQLVLAPTQGLHLVPFQALMTEQGSFLSESYALNIVPSLATIRVLHEKDKRSKQTQPIPNRLLSVSHSGEKHNYLENVSLETQEVGIQFDDSIFVSEEDATLERVIDEANQRPYQVVHFNCHGNFLPNSPAHSGLLLAQQRVLSINDIRIRIRLQGSPLVTLSACQTGQTLPEQGDETTGISWAFLAAGASSVLSSQWSVPDASTRELFYYFYQLRRQPELSEAEALQKAMAEVRKRQAYNKRPEYWAGFQIMGLPTRL